MYPDNKKKEINKSFDQNVLPSSRVVIQTGKIRWKNYEQILRTIL